LISIATAVPADENLLTKRGKTVYPYFNKAGELNFIICNDQGSTIILRATQPLSNIHSGSIQSYSNLQTLQIKKDNGNNNWMIWEYGKDQEEDVFLGRIQERKICHTKNISLGIKGKNIFPSLAFSPNNQAWVTWINTRGGQSQLIVKNLDASLIWSIPSNSSLMYSPQIIIDGTGKPWLFWIEPKKRMDRLYYSFFNGETWTTPLTLDSNPEAPHFHPAATLNKNGYPWVSWSSYDGEDYEIFTTSWNGNKWLEIERITNNSSLSDAEPSISLYLNSIPMISWSQAGNGKRDNFISFKTESGWYPAINISHDNKRSQSPILITEGHKIAVAWKDGKNVYVKHLSFFELQAERHPEITEKISVKSIHLASDRFIGFGDSITYGSMNGPFMGKGYIPRLLDLLKNNYVEPYISNRGIPGEQTWEGLSRIDSVISADLALYLLLMEGTNDITAIQYSMNTTAFNLKQMVQKSLDYGVIPLISNIIPRTRNLWKAIIRARTFDLNSKIESLAQEFNLSLVDNYNAFYNYPEKQGGFESLISADNLHPSNTGYQIMAETWHDNINFIPFPPVNLSQTIVANKAFLYQEYLNHLFWSNNPKNQGRFTIVKYRIYRKTTDQEDTLFIQVGEVAAPQTEFIDRKFSSREEANNYIYGITSVDEENNESNIRKG